MPDLISEIVQRIAADQAKVQEQAAEQALQGGEHGISTIHHGLRCSSGVDPRVPYGHHFVFPSPESYNNWINRGAPTA